MPYNGLELPYFIIDGIRKYVMTQDNRKATPNTFQLIMPNIELNYFSNFDDFSLDVLKILICRRYIWKLDLGFEPRNGNLENKMLVYIGKYLFLSLLMI